MVREQEGTLALLQGLFAVLNKQRVLAMRRKANICTQQVRSQSGVSLCTLQAYLTHTYTYPQQTRHARNAYACVQYIRMCVHMYVHTMLLHRSSPVQVKQSMWKCLSWTLRTSPEHILLQMWHKITGGKGGEGRKLELNQSMGTTHE